MCKLAKILTTLAALSLGIFAAGPFAQEVERSANNLDVLKTADMLGRVYNAYQTTYPNFQDPCLVMAKGVPSGGGTVDSVKKLNKWTFFYTFTPYGSLDCTEGSDQSAGYTITGTFDLSLPDFNNPLTAVSLRVSPTPLTGVKRVSLATVTVTLDEAIAVVRKKELMFNGRIYSADLHRLKESPYPTTVYMIKIQVTVGTGTATKTVAVEANSGVFHG